MEYSNAFVGSRVSPTRLELEAALGPSITIWDEFIARMAKDLQVAEQEWTGIAAKKYGWHLRLKQKTRNIVYLGPGKGCFLVAFVLSDKALKAAKEARLSKAVRAALDAAPRYPEGNGLRLVVQRNGDMPPIRTLARIKLAS